MNAGDQLGENFSSRSVASGKLGNAAHILEDQEEELGHC